MKRNGETEFRKPGAAGGATAATDRAKTVFSAPAAPRDDLRRRSRFSRPRSVPQPHYPAPRQRPAPPEQQRSAKAPDRTMHWAPPGSPGREAIQELRRVRKPT